MEIYFSIIAKESFFSGFSSLHRILFYLFPGRENAVRLKVLMPTKQKKVLKYYSFAIPSCKIYILASSMNSVAYYVYL